MANDEGEVKTGEEAGADSTGAEGNEGEGASKGDTAPKETPQERFARLQGMTKRAAKDAGIEWEEPSQKKTSKKSDGELDYGQKAFLIANGIKDAAEIELASEFMKNTGKSLDDVIGSSFFQGSLKEMRDQKATAAAVPNSGKRSGQSAQDTVAYWIQKGELPPASEAKLRQDVVNARIKAESSTNNFTSNPVASNK